MGSQVDQGQGLSKEIKGNPEINRNPKKSLESNGTQTKTQYLGEYPKVANETFLWDSLLQQNAMDFASSRCDPPVFDKCPIPRPRINEVTHM